MACHVYIMTCRSHTALYIGVTDALRRDVAKHRAGTGCAHTRRYNITKLVYVEPHDTWHAAEHRAGQLKRWRRAWKTALITKNNPAWMDLSMGACLG